MAQRRGTSHEVAKLAGGSQSTISIVLSEKQGILIAGVVFRRSQASFEIRFSTPNHCQVAGARARRCCGSDAA